MATLSYVYARAGRKAEAQRLLNELQEMSGRRRIPPYDFARIYSALGDKEQAFAWLNKALAERSDGLVYMENERAFEPLRSDPRFADLVRRAGLSP